MQLLMRRMLALLTLAVLIVGCATSYEQERHQIGLEAELNNGGAQGAPQQAVAAEWAVRDYAALIAKQNTEQAYLLYGVVGLLALSLITSLVVAGRLSRTNQALADLRSTIAADAFRSSASQDATQADDNEPVA
jgi:hypothetical protein